MRQTRCRLLLAIILSLATNTQRVSPFGAHLHILAPCPRTRAICFSATTNEQDPHDEILLAVVPRKKKQVRRKNTKEKRRPRYYWSDIDNVKQELRQFWKDVNVTISSGNEGEEPPPTIPNEALLNYFGKHNLRYGIVSFGGRRALAYRLGGARIMPGKWSMAVQQSPELQQLLQLASSSSSGSSVGSLRPDGPPPSPQQQRQQKRKKKLEYLSSSHKPDRKPNGYWTEEIAIKELYDYLSQQPGRPCTWMPRYSELVNNGRGDLTRALQRFIVGGSDAHQAVCQKAGLVPFHEWQYFESQCELYVELQQYLQIHPNNNNNNNNDGKVIIFPVMSDVQRNGYHNLYSLVQQHGGRRYLAGRLGMQSSANNRNALGIHDGLEMNWGPFSLDFAIRLLTWVRMDQMRRRPLPLSQGPATIAMPTRKELLEEELMSGGASLVNDIERFGGFENVARRLGLAYF